MKSLSRWATRVSLVVMALTASSEALAQSRASQPAQRPSVAVVAAASSSATSASSAQRGAPATATSAGAASEGVVNINTATEDELRRLPLVGPARATAILALRTRVQRFRSPDDLLRVRGIGRASMRRLRPYVTLTGETTLLSRPGRTRNQASLTAP
jgi:competence protein ComEA